ncbi:SusE domain-containing protein [Sphingobacterium sp. Mn56C]|uniref:SusE domain-containing protein n=1 Tax=Sphingobacterium sp. Mn56C TaxID=3395261 RepID=UPI003BDA0930
MKTKTYIWQCIILLTSTVVACKTDNMNYKDVDITAVDNLFEPLDNRSIKLSKSPSAALFFEWENALAADAGSVQYEVVFDRKDGDFSKPVYKALSDRNGFSNNAYITHKVLNSMAISAGIKPGETGEFNWSVISTRGTQRLLSPIKRSLTLTSFEGFADIPEELYVTGAATESAENLSQALPFKQVVPGEFELYTKLEAGKAFVFVDRKVAGFKAYYSEDQAKLQDAPENAHNTVAKTAVYRIAIDFNLASIRYTEIQSIGVFFSPDDRIILDLPYQGSGIWKGTGTINFKQESWGRDERYKFQMVTLDNGKLVTLQWGAKNSTDSRPNASSPASYYYLKLLNQVTRWDDKWKFADIVDGKLSSVSVILQGNKEYTHSIEVK